jgi:hypothetical protein
MLNPLCWSKLLRLTFLFSALTASSRESRAFITVPQDGTLTFELVSTHAGTSVQEFGIGTPAVSSTTAQRQYLFVASFQNDTLASVFPGPIVDAGFFSAGTELDFYQRSTFIELKWAFTSRLATAPTFTDLEAFTDRNNSLGLGGGVLSSQRPNTWLLYVDSAGSVDDDDNDMVIRMTLHPLPEPHSGIMAAAGVACFAAWQRGGMNRRR